MGLLFALTMVACHKEEQAVVGVAKTAENAEHQAQVAATKRDQQRAALDRIPLPTKSMYVDIREPGAWLNPFLSVDADTLDLRINLADANPSTVGQGTILRTAAARRQEIQLHPADLADAVVALPPERGVMDASSPSLRFPVPVPKTAPRSAATSKPPSSSSTTSA